MNAGLYGTELVALPPLPRSRCRLRLRRQVVVDLQSLREHVQDQRQEVRLRPRGDSGAWSFRNTLDLNLFHCCLRRPRLHRIRELLQTRGLGSPCTLEDFLHGVDRGVLVHPRPPFASQMKNASFERSGAILAANTSRRTIRTPIRQTAASILSGLFGVLFWIETPNRPSLRSALST